MIVSLLPKLGLQKLHAHDGLMSPCWCGRCKLRAGSQRPGRARGPFWARSARRARPLSCGVLRFFTAALRLAHQHCHIHLWQRTIPSRAELEVGQHRRFALRLTCPHRNVTEHSAAGRGPWCVLQVRPAWPLGQSMPSTNFRMVPHSGLARSSMIQHTPSEILTRRARWCAAKAMGLQAAVMAAAMPCEAILCHTTILPCHTMPCHYMPCQVRPGQPTPRHAMPCHAVSCMPLHSMPCHDIPCHAIPDSPTGQIPCRPALCHAMT